MRSEKEVWARREVFSETLAGIYGKDMPYEEERLQARINEDEWFLNGKSEEKVNPNEK